MLMGYWFWLVKFFCFKNICIEYNEIINGCIVMLVGLKWLVEGLFSKVNISLVVKGYF